MFSSEFMIYLDFQKKFLLFQTFSFILTYMLKINIFYEMFQVSRLLINL